MSYRTTHEYRQQGGTGTYRVSGDYTQRHSLVERVEREIVFSPGDKRMPDEGICVVLSSREDAEHICKLLNGS